MALQRLRNAQKFVETQTNFSRFEVLELIGTGSNGVVFKCRARDRRVQGDLAIKVVINYGSDPQVSTNECLCFLLVLVGRMRRCC